MNVGFDARLYGIFDRGLGRYNFSLLSNLADLDQVNKYWVFGNAERLSNLPTGWAKIQAPWRVYSVGEQLKLPLLLKKYPLDLVHWPHFNVPFLYSKPFIVTIHDMIMHEFPNERATTLLPFVYRLKWSLYRNVFESAIKRAQAIITVSQATKKTLLEYYPKIKSKISVIYEAPTVDGRQYHNLPRLLENFYLLYVGASYPHKNLILLAKTFRELLFKWPSLRLVLVGRSDFFYERLKKELQAMSINKGIIFWGEATDEALASLYAHASVYITPSLAEGFNLSAVEALSFGCPVVASDLPVHREILGRAALFAKKDQIEDYVKLVGQTLASDASKLAQSGHTASVLSHYSWQIAAQETQQLYQEALLRFKTTHTI